MQEIAYKRIYSDIDNFSVLIEVKLLLFILFFTDTEGRSTLILKNSILSYQKRYLFWGLLSKKRGFYKKSVRMSVCIARDQFNYVIFMKFGCPRRMPISPYLFFDFQFCSKKFPKNREKLIL